MRCRTYGRRSGLGLLSTARLAVRLRGLKNGRAEADKQLVEA
jgi:hypothetical protein